MKLRNRKSPNHRNWQLILITSQVRTMTPRQPPQTVGRPLLHPDHCVVIKHRIKWLSVPCVLDACGGVLQMSVQPTVCSATGSSGSSRQSYGPKYAPLSVCCIAQNVLCLSLLVCLHTE